ncbi:MAG: shikimate kinase [Bacillales bacterium]|jgi:shikimate kinase|nr:shikimate kinase [Bacillales bacterium]
MEVIHIVLIISVSLLLAYLGKREQKKYYERASEDHFLVSQPVSGIWIGYLTLAIFGGAFFIDFSYTLVHHQKFDWEFLMLFGFFACMSITIIILNRKKLIVSKKNIILIPVLGRRKKIVNNEISFVKVLTNSIRIFLKDQPKHVFTIGNSEVGFANLLQYFFDEGIALQPNFETIYLVGMDSVGKTTVGERLSELLNYEFIDLDTKMIQFAGKYPQEILNSIGETKFHQMELTYLSAIPKKNTIVAIGSMTIESPESREWLKENGMVVHLTAEIDKLVERMNRKSQVRESSIKDKNTLIYLNNVREPWYDEISQIIVKTDDFLPNEVARIIVSAVFGFVGSYNNNRIPN